MALCGIQKGSVRPFGDITFEVFTARVLQANQIFPGFIDAFSVCTHKNSSSCDIFNMQSLR